MLCWQVYEGGPPKQDYLLKNCVLSLSHLNFSHLQSTLRLMQYTYWVVFSTAQNSFWTHRFLYHPVLLPFFISPLPHQQNISLWELFSTGKTKKVAQHEFGWIGRVEQGGHTVFVQKLLDTQCGAGRCPCKSPMMKWANTLKESSKKSLKPNAACHNNDSWHTDTVVFLEHWPSGAAYNTRGPPSER